MTIDVDSRPAGVDSRSASVVVNVRSRADGAHHKQKHYSAAFRSSTEKALVIYESRLELARPLLADFDSSVRRILARPFLTAADKRALASEFASHGRAELLILRKANAYE